MENNLLLRTLANQKVERPPIWLMRQAGRILPEYREIRQSLSGFKALVSNPELAAKVTIQPVDRLGVDAAIIFSDILVIPEAMGLDYELIEKKGPWFPKTIQNIDDVMSLRSGEDAASRLGYVYEALEITKEKLNNRVPLIGFSGAPWTLFAYMLEGSGSKTFSIAKRMLYQDEELSHLLLDKITETIIAYLDRKLESGSDVLQLFDSWTGVLNADLFSKFCVPYVSRIINHFRDRAPLIYFPRGAHFAMNDIKALNPKALSLDWTFDGNQVRSTLGENIVLQGNIDPVCLFGSIESIELEVNKCIKSIGQAHIFNLGHGVYPDTPLDKVIHLVNYVKSIRY